MRLGSWDGPRMRWRVALLMLGLVGCVLKEKPSGVTTWLEGTTSGSSSGEGVATGMVASSGTTGEAASTSGSSTGGGTIGEGEGCDFHAQDCADGLRCVSTGRFCGGDPWVCVPLVAAPLGEGAWCEVFDYCRGIDECDAGLYCVLTDWEEQAGTCARLCEGEVGVGFSCPGVGELCHQVGQHVLVCIETCDPLVQGCPVGMTCVHIEGSESHFGCATLDPGAGGFMSPCASDVDCLPGLACGYGGPDCESTCCVEYCEVGGPGACDAVPGTSCQAYLGTEFGLCAPP